MVNESGIFGPTLACGGEGTQLPLPLASDKQRFGEMFLSSESWLEVPPVVWYMFVCRASIPTVVIHSGGYPDFLHQTISNGPGPR